MMKGQRSRHHHHHFHHKGAAAGLLVLVASLVVFASEGCRQVVGIEDSSASSAIQTCGGITFSNDSTCSDCMATSCCAEAERCSSSSNNKSVSDGGGGDGGGGGGANMGECKELVLCITTCAPDDHACASACRARFPAGDGFEAASLRSCEAVSCGTACKLTCGGYVYSDPKCAACGNASCCDAATKCMSDRECSALVACEHSCGYSDKNCLLLCELAHPDGRLAARAFGDCLNASCAPTCIAPQWTCLQKQTAPPRISTGPGITMTLGFIDYATQQRIPGLRVRACGPTDVGCVTDIVPSVVTDPTGLAFLRLGSFFDGYTEITGEGYGPVLFYLPPLSKDFVLFTAISSHTTFITLGSALTTIDPERATVFVHATDCTGQPAKGVRFSIEPSEGSTPFYFAHRIPSLTATETDGDNGTGGFGNVKANTAITVRATVVENGLSLPSAVVFGRVGPGYTYVTLFAEPP